MVNREKRKTAGQRMTTLVGKAQEEDDAFWDHETWQEDSGNESFRESDEDSELQKDEFDSDFDESETDNEEEEAAAGEEEEREIQKQERSNRQRKGSYVDIAKGGRALMQKTKGTKGSRRTMGNGINAGIVLNFPSSDPSSGVALPTAASGVSPETPAPASVKSSQSLPEIQTSSSSPTSPSAGKRRRLAAELGVQPTLASVRERRSQTRKRDSRNSDPTYSDASSHASKKLKPQTGVTKKTKRRQYGQEELLLEAVKDTEPENMRWLLARKRVQDSADQDRDALAAFRDKHRGKNVIEKYHSRRGCLMTLTFPNMDSVPDFLTRKHEPPAKPKTLICAVTGNLARYRDPKTGRGYVDMAAFKELRRRHDAGEPLDQKPKAKPKVETYHPEVDGACGGDGTPTPNGQPPKSPKSPKSPSSGIRVDLGRVAKSPASTRMSGRKWKPSEKMLQGLGLKKEDDSKSASSPEQCETVDSTVLASVPPLPSMPARPKEESTPDFCPALKPSTAAMESASTSSATPAKISVDKRSTAVSSESSSQSKSKLPKNGNAAKQPTRNVAMGIKPVEFEPADSQSGETKPASRSESKPAAKTVVVASASKPSEQVYVIPGDGENGSSEPRYMTQSELIMQAINNYSRKHENGTTFANGNAGNTNANANT